VLTKATPGELVGLGPTAKHVVDVGQLTPPIPDVRTFVIVPPPVIRTSPPLVCTTVGMTKQLELDVQDMPPGSNGKFGEPALPETTGSVIHVCPPFALKASSPFTKTPWPMIRLAEALPATQSRVGAHTMSLVPGWSPIGAEANGFVRSCQVVPPSVVAKRDKVVLMSPTPPDNRQLSADEHEMESNSNTPLGRPSFSHVAPPFVVVNNAFGATV
jgi:hypothetical protein